MNLEAYTEDHILEDLKKLQYLYGLKRTIRYNQERHSEDATESVVEHVYGMHLLAQHFLLFEDPEKNLDHSRIFEMITLHDLDEIETGDVLGYTKSEAQRAEEVNAMMRVVLGAPPHMQQHMKERVEEYEAKESLEARFARAIDKVEPIVHIYHEEVRKVLMVNMTTAEQSLRIKTPYVADFPFIKKFCEVTHTHLEREGYFWTEE